MPKSAAVSRRTLLVGIPAAATTVLLSEPVLALGAGTRLHDWRLAFADAMADIAELPLMLVHGRPPPDLRGTLYRNGPARFRRPGGSAAHWFDGDGMIRAFSISERGATLRARFVDTPKRRADSAANAVVTGGFATAGARHVRPASNDAGNAANTSVIAHGDELWALWEGGSPVAVDPMTLQTHGMRTLREDLPHVPFLAHPRVDSNGGLWNLGQLGDEVIVWRLARDGLLQEATRLKLPRASYIHDFAVTPTHLVILLQPWIFKGHGTPLTDALEWREDLGTQVMVLDKQDLARSRLYELPSFFFFHIGSAWSSADKTIFLDVCRYPDPTFAIQGGCDLIGGTYRPTPPPTLALITLAPGGSASMRDTGIVAELPRIQPSDRGRSAPTTVYTSVEAKGRPLFQGVGTYDWQTERRRQFDFGAWQVTEEMLFVPKPRSTGSAAGWIVGCSINLRKAATELHVFDAGHVDSGPICTWRAPLSLPMGLHGMFIPGDVRS
jgi:carotenoid cleavage dioxygenase-like enzyme